MTDYTCLVCRHPRSHHVDPTGTIYRPGGQLPCGHTEPKDTHA